MKTYIFIIVILFGATISAQEITCIDYKLYNANYDVEQLHEEKTSLTTLKKEKVPIQDNQLQLVVLPNTHISFSKWSSYRKKKTNKGFKILIVNTTKAPLNIKNIDGIISFTRQVYYKNAWRTLVSFDKEPLRILCGNSYLSNKIIEPQEVQSFIAPCISGNITVPIRFMIKTKPLEYGDPDNGTIIYSNTFEGSFNEALLK